MAVSGGGTWKQISLGISATCGIKSDDTAWCWGSDTSGMLGNGATGNTTAPGLVTGGATWKAISMSFYNTCGIKSDDTLWCWGNDSNGQVGNGATTGDQQDPVAVTGGSTWKAVSVSYAFACGIKSDNTAWCWGYDGGGQLGNGATTANQPDPVAVNGGGAWKKINTGYQVTCGIKSDDTAWCWGLDSSLMIGNGAVTGNQDVPVPVIGGALWQDIDVSDGVPGEHVCGITTLGDALCWGLNGSGQLGIGAPSYNIAPATTVCGAPYGKPGAIRYNSTENRLQYCDSVNWAAFGGFGSGATVIPPSDPCAGSPSVGTVCSDGTIYAGLTPDGNVPMYTTRCDAGMTWDGSSCLGVSSALWNNGDNDWTATGYTSPITGQANTAGIVPLDADSDDPGHQDHDAAVYCDTLSQDGHNDWYLPAKDELAVLYTNRAAIGNLSTSVFGAHWSSTEDSMSAAWRHSFNSGVQASTLKNTAGSYLRCVRK